MTLTTASGKNSATTWSRINLSRDVGLYLVECLQLHAV